MKVVIILDLDFDEQLDDLQNDVKEVRLYDKNNDYWEWDSFEIKPVPEKKNSLTIDDTIIKDKFGVETIYFEKAIQLAKEKGYNACIDELLGETE